MKRSNKNARQVSNALWLSRARKYAENYAKEHTFVTSDNVVEGVGRAKTINATGALFRNGNFQSVGYNLIIITNQSGIARGYYKEEDFYRLNKWMLKQFTNHGIKILDIF